MGFSRDIVAKLYDVSGWRRHQLVVFGIGKLAALSCLVLIIRTPLKIGQDVFFISIVLCVVGSWTAVTLWLASAVGYHFHILGEETACLTQYGTAYEGYLKRVPRYLLFV